MSNSRANKNSNSSSPPPPNLSIQTSTFSAFFLPQATGGAGSEALDQQYCRLLIPASSLTYGGFFQICFLVSMRDISKDKEQQL